MKRFLLQQKGVFALLLALFLGLGTAYAHDFSATCSTGQTLYYNIIDATNHYVEITYPGTINNWWEGFDKPTGEIALPSSVTHNGVTYSVKAIGDNAFYKCSGLTGTLTIPNSMTSIGISAFYECTGFTGPLTIPNSVTTIGSSAFNFCSGFTGSLTLSNSLTEIKNFTFYGCSGLTGSLDIPNSVTTIGDYAFLNCSGLTGSLTLSNSLNTIGEFAFQSCGFTGSLTIPSSVTTIGDRAFVACNGFTGPLTIPNSVTTVGEFAFAHCNGFTGTLTIGKYMASIGLKAFLNCTGFTQLSYNAINCAGYDYEHKKNAPFHGNSWSLSIGDGVQTIPAWMFYDCSGITGTLLLPNSVTSIGEGAFSACTGLNSLYLSNSLTTIGIYAFEGCSGLTGKLTIPDSVTTIGIYAFANCTSLSSLVIGSNISTMDYGAFYQCGNLGSITVHREAPPTLAADVFYNVPKTIPVSVPCGSLSAYQAASGWSEFTNMTAYCDPLIYSINPDGVSVTVIGHEDGTSATGELIIPEAKTINGVTYTVTAIGELAFNDCSGLTGSLTIPNTVITIGRGAFWDCTGFTGSLTIGNSVTSIADHAFDGCNNLTGSLTIPNSVTQIGEYAFTWCENLTGSLFIPNHITELPEGVFEYCKKLSGGLILPNSLTTIDYAAFLGCNNFTGSLTIPNSVTTIAADAFYQCFGLNGTLTIGTSVASIGSGAFYSCPFTLINYNAANCAGYNQYNVSPFINLNASLTIGNTVQVIPELMFSKCTGLTGTLTIPTSVTTIGYGAFYECSGFTGSLKIPNSVTSIGGNAFLACSGFNGTLTLPSYLTTIENGTFRNCSGFTGSLTIPDRVTSIGDEAFLDCEGFTGYLHIGNSVSTIGAYAFNYCTGFTGSLTIPESVTEIGPAAFQSCMGFTGDLNIEGPVTSIGSRTFNYCRNLTGSLTLPNTVTEIGEMAFNYCDKLTSINAFPETPPTLGANAFQHVPTNIPVYVPCGSLSAYQSASGWNAFTNMQCPPWTVTLTANPWGGGYVDYTDSNGTNGHYLNGATCTVLATPHDNYLFMHWSENGTVVSSNPSYSFNVYEDTDLEAVFMALSDAGDIIGEGTGTNVYLPCYSFYKYSLTEQIYTADELDGISTITSISFFNEGPTKTRTLSIYLMPTNKAAFSSTTDWISANLSNVAFGGSVTMRSGMWTTITLSRPFVYNGTSNLVLIVDDNTGSYTGYPHMACRTYAADGNQTLRIYSDDINYAPNSPSSYTGTFMQVKNQIMLNRVAYNIDATTADETAGTVSGGGQYGQGDLCSLKATPNTGYTFLSWSDSDGTVITTEAEYSFFVTQNRSLVANFLTGTDVCSLTFELNDFGGDGWNGNYLVVDLGEGVSQRLAVTADIGFDATYTLPVVNGSHVDLGWIQGSYADECFFKVRYSNENIVFVSIDVDLNSNFEYGFDVDCNEMPANWTFLGYDDNGGSNFLPSHSYYKYSMSQQIYIADEIGSEGNITSIAFYNENYGDDDNTKTRTYDIYLKATNKNEFFTGTDWISVTEDDKVFSGNVTMTSNEWTLITFDKPFVYDGTSNLALIVDDNTGSFTSAPHMSCRTYYYNGDNQAIYVNDDGTNYNPNSPSAYNGTLMNEKNQVYFGFSSSLDCWHPWLLTTTDITDNSAVLEWTGFQDSYNVRYRVALPFYEDFEEEESFAADWTFISMNTANDIGPNANTAGLNFNAAHSGEYGFRFSSYYSAEDYNQYLVSPKLDVTGELIFYYKQSNDVNTETFKVGYSTTSNVLDAFAWTNLTLTSSWQEYTLQLPSNVKYIAFHYYGDFAWYVYLDDITIGGNGITMVDWVTVNNVASTTTEITNLAPSTNYEWQVQGNNTSCNDNGTTRWSKKAIFTTKCEALVVDAENPFSEDFEGEDFAPDCWETFSTGLYQWTRYRDYHHSGSASACSHYYGDNYLVLPELELSANASAAQLTFWSYNKWINDFVEGNNTVVLLDGDTETVLWSAETVSQSWVETTIDLTAYLGQTVNLAFKYSGNDGNIWFVDDVEVSVEPVSTVTQTIALSAGVNWFSTYVEITLDDLKAALEDALLNASTTNSIIIKSQRSGQTTYNGTRWRGALNTFDVACMYQITVPEGCEITLEGMPIDPAQHPVIIKNGPNWIGFPFSANMTPTDAFAGFVINGDQISSKTQKATYNNRWRGALSELVPGQGYIYHSAVTGNRIFTFPIIAK